MNRSDGSCEHLLEEGELAHALSGEAKVLSLAEQLEDLRANHAYLHTAQNPALPPFSIEQICAIEAAYNFKFPPLLRLYGLNITREMKRELFYGGGSDTEPFSISTACRWFPVESMDSMSCHSFTSFEENIHMILSGKLKSFVFLVEEYGEERFASWKTSFHGLRGSLDAIGCVPFRLAVVGSKLIDFVPESSRHALPENLKATECLNRSTARTFLQNYHLSEESANALVCKHVLPAVMKIQRQFRLWQWRMQNTFNPHSHFGNLNLWIKAQAAVNEQ